MKSTDLKIIATLSRIVTQVCDTLLGDRTEAPLVVASACQIALATVGIKSKCMYGDAAWIELQDDQKPVWAGAWEPGVHFWLHTEFAEIVDLNVSVACRKQASHSLMVLSAPMLWSNEIPHFYRYKTLGIAEIQLSDPQEKLIFECITEHIQNELSKIDFHTLEITHQCFPPEPLLCSDRKILDDTQESFKKFDRAISIYGIPPVPSIFLPLSPPTPLH